MARALCQPEASKIRSLEQLYGALQLGPGNRRVAATTHSLSLSGRTVSAANPRVFVMSDHNATAGFAYEDIVVTAFTRGEQAVELAAVDPTTYEYNFYLLSFAQSCNASGCTPSELLTQQVESGWSSWTLYVDSQLENTPLDCLSCHRPFGAKSRKILQMRQDFDPWMHWSDFRGLDENGCGKSMPDGVAPKVIVSSDGIDLVTKLEGEKGAYGGVPLAELRATPSGDVMTAFLAAAENLINSAPIPPHPYAQFSLRTRETLCERFYTGQSPSWEEDRRLSQARGLPFPYFGADILSPEARAGLLADREAAWRRAGSSDAFDVLSSLWAPEVASATGFSPRESDSATEILRGLCSRCHAADTSPTLSRGRFVWDAPAVTQATLDAVKERLSLPPAAAKAMPPRVAGHLPGWARDRVLTHLRSLCSPADTCR